MDCETPAVAAYLRTQRNVRLLIIHNLSAVPQTINLSMIVEMNGKITDLLENKPMNMNRKQPSLSLQPYEYRWLLIPI